MIDKVYTKALESLAELVTKGVGKMVAKNLVSGGALCALWWL